MLYYNDKTESESSSWESYIKTSNYKQYSV